MFIIQSGRRTWNHDIFPPKRIQTIFCTSSSINARSKHNFSSVVVSCSIEYILDIDRITFTVLMHSHTYIKTMVAKQKYLQNDLKQKNAAKTKPNKTVTLLHIPRMKSRSKFVQTIRSTIFMTHITVNLHGCWDQSGDFRSPNSWHTAISKFSFILAYHCQSTGIFIIFPDLWIEFSVLFWYWSWTERR